MESHSTNTNAIIKEVLLDATPAKVWKAITDRDEMKQWYFDLKEFKAIPGFEFQFEGGPDDRKYLHKCRITEVVPGKKLQYSWRYENHIGNSFVTFELFEEGEKTRLRLTHAGLETFPQDNSDFARESFNGGWTELIKHLLRQYLETAKP